VAIGIALAKKRDGKKNRVYALIGTEKPTKVKYGEAAMSAPKFRLDNLVVILDRNNIQQDGFTEDIMPLDPVRDKMVRLQLERN
jgi:transketolase